MQKLRLSMSSAPRYNGPYKPEPREVPKPTTGQSVIEYVLFFVFGILLIVAGIAVYTMFSPSHHRVPNLVDQGLKAHRLNIVRRAVRLSVLIHRGVCRRNQPAC